MAQESSRPDFWDTRYRDGVMPWDARRVPPDLRGFLKTLSSGARILVPGCGSAHEVYYLARQGFDVTAVDFSSQSVEMAQRNLGCFANRVRLADFFSFEHERSPFDVLYERAFLCALPRKMRGDYARRAAQLVKPEGRLAGFFFYADTPRRPPFKTSPEELHALLDGDLELVEDRLACESLPVFAGGER